MGTSSCSRSNHCLPTPNLRLSREGLSSGHMPGSINIPFNELLDPETKAYKSPEELKKYFQEKGVDPEKPVVASCGTGVTACVVDAGLEIAGYPEMRRVYDGSWTEWAQRVRPSDNLILKDAEIGGRAPAFMRNQ